MKKIRWGVLSTAKIGLEKVIPAMQKGEYCEMAAKKLRCIIFEKKDRIIIHYLNSFEYLPESFRIPRPGFDIRIIFSV